MENPDQNSNGLTGIEVLHRILVNGHMWKSWNSSIHLELSYIFLIQLNIISCAPLTATAMGIASHQPLISDTEES